ncbi:MAG: WG repeat-containing protein, partial [Cytophagaceae bacterium]
MIKKYFILVLLCTMHCALSTTFAQKGSNCPEDLVPRYSEQSKTWGYVNVFGQWVINPIYTKVTPYIENKAVVQKGLKYGVIDCDGNVILHPEYDKLTSFRNGKIWARKNGFWGLLNEKGTVLLEFVYTEINPIAGTELTWVKKDSVWGLITEDKGSFICRPQFRIAQVMSENATLVQIIDLYGVINHVNCGYLLPMNITKVKKVALHIIIFQQNGKWGIFNEQGKISANAIYDSLSLKYTDILIYKKDNKYGFINLNGKEITGADYDYIDDYSEGLFLMKQKGKYGYINRFGKYHSKPQFEDASSFKKSQAIAKKDGKYGIIDLKNKFILNNEYSFLGRNKNADYYYVKAKNPSGGKEKFYLYGRDMKKITETGFDSLYVSDSISLTRVINEGKVSFYNILQKVPAFSGSYEEAKPFKNGVAFVKQNGKWGVISDKGKEILPAVYDQVDYEWFQKTLMFSTKKEDKLGLADASGKVILSNEYEAIATALPNYLKVKKGGKWGVIRTTGGTPVVDFLYDHISNKTDNPTAPDWPAIVQKKDKFGIVNEKGDEIYEAKAHDIYYVGEGLYAVKE